MWFLIVSLAFSIAGFVIANSYLAWQANPVATTITTHPIADLDFPTVTVCPPLATHTALNYDLMKADNNSLTEEERDELKRKTFALVTKPTHEDYIRSMVEAANKENLKYVYEGSQSIPEAFTVSSGFRTEVWSKNGTWHTPWYKDGYQPGHFTEDKNHHFVLNFTAIEEQEGKGSLSIILEVDIRKANNWEESVTYSEGSKYRSAPEVQGKPVKKSWSEALAYCGGENGSLASIQSAREQEEVEGLAGGGSAWIGLKGMSWVDGARIGFKHFKGGLGKWKGSNDCGVINKQGKNMWGFDSCQDWRKHNFICQTTVGVQKKSLKLKYDTAHMKSMQTFQVWYMYRSNENTIKSLRNWKSKKMTGFKVTWSFKSKKAGKKSTQSQEGIEESEQSKNTTQFKPNPHLREIVATASKGRIKKITSQEMTDTVIQKKEALILGGSFQVKEMCSGGQIRPVFLPTIFQEMNFGTNDSVENITSINTEDIETGFRKFSAIVYCSESVGLSQFLHILLSSQSPRTILQATVNTIMYGDLQESVSRKAVGKFYHALDKIFGLHFGKILLATRTEKYGLGKGFIRDMLASDLPFLDLYKKDIKMCLDQESCKGVEDLIRSLGNLMLTFCFFYAFS